MKKFFLILTCALTFGTVHGQWVDDPTKNTPLVQTKPDAEEIYLATNETTGDTYMQWNSDDTNGYAVNLQRIDVNGVAKWGEKGIHISSHQFDSFSQGYALALTSDNAIVSCFANIDNECIIMKFDQNGNTLWGENGISVFEFPQDSYKCASIKLVAGNDGGVWVLADDIKNSYIRYIKADGTLNPTSVISDESFNCSFGQLTLGDDNRVFLTFEKTDFSGAPAIKKELWVTSFATDGTMLSDPEQLMPQQTLFSNSNHKKISDGLGGGYAWICRSDNSAHFNTYVFHYDANGESTFSDPQGVPVHSPHPYYNFNNPFATVDPATHDIILAYRQQYDSLEVIYTRLYLNRITTMGEVVWGDGICITDFYGEEYKYPMIDIFPDGSGFMVCYQYGSGYSTIEALGFDMDGNQIWHTQMNSVLDAKTFTRNSTGFHNGQNIFAWANIENGIIYGQNIDKDGNMGAFTSVEEVDNSLTANIFQRGDNLIIHGENLSHIEIINILGQIKKREAAEGELTEINVSNLKHDIYIVRVRDNFGNIYDKEIVIF